MAATTQVLVCGGGNAAHVCAGLMGSRGAHVKVNVLDTFKDEAERWSNRITVHHTGGTTVGTLNKVSKHAAEVVPGTDVAIIALPTFGHLTYLQAIKPYLKPGMIIVALVDRGGFDLKANHVLGRNSGAFFTGFNTLPWACRIKTYGSEVEVLGTKESVSQVFSPAIHMEQTRDKVQMLLGDRPQLEIAGNFLVAPFALGGVIHPMISYGTLKNWDGRPFQKAPLFYQGVDENAADILEKVSAEHFTLSKLLSDRSGGRVDMSSAKTVYQWLTGAYAAQISDKSSLKRAFNTNAAYDGLTHPTKAVDGGLTIDFTHRYYSEDVPLGLVFVRGIAELAGFPTPGMDEVLTWCQAKMGKEWLVNGRLNGKDVKDTSVPQNYGYANLETFLEQYAGSPAKL